MVSEINIICECEKKTKIILVGHSLGYRLIYRALENDEKSHKLLYKIYLCGGAVYINEYWEELKIDNVAIENNWTENDKILKILYRIAEKFEEPIGLNSINKVRQIINNNLTKYVNGHSNYFETEKIISKWFKL